MRAVPSQLVGENLEAETIPLTFKRNGGEEIIPAPIAYAPDLWLKMEGLMNSSDDSTQGYDI
jgi:hypothetical protein